MKKKLKVAAAGVGADDFQPAETSTKAPATSGKSFFDLAPEIRNEIYHHLFDDLKVTVQEKDTDHCYPGRPPVRTIVRQRMMGLNIIFVSKQCYAEARPILLSAAEFNIDMPTMFTGRRGRSSTQTWPKTFQGFSAPDLTLVRKLDLSRMFFNCQGTLRNRFVREPVVKQLQAMPRLQSLIVPVTHISMGCDWRKLLTQPNWDEFTMLCMGGIRSEFIQQVAQQFQMVAETTNQRPRLLMRWNCYFYLDDKRTVVYVDGFSGVVWVAYAADETKILVPKQVELKFRLFRE